jgi:DNA polymerase V|tara:strand:- start:1083 stop:2348 length:1266 start_codon:yes stop_codon:yes gene_type:complete
MIYALVDCNSFYASCERIFRPDLKAIPIVVLSNNDGCVVALSKEAKKIGIKMCEPWFKIKDNFTKNGGIAFSSNYELYADISSRVMQILEQLSPKIEIYSIDEAFLDLTGIEKCTELESFGRQCQETILQWVGMPVSVGIGPTKTLAKVAQYGAKKYHKTNGVVDLSDKKRQIKLMSLMPVGEVWGVGKRINKKLNAMGIFTALELANMDIKFVKNNFSSVLGRTLMELKGYSCIGLDENPAIKKQIIVSRTFGHRVTDLDSINEAVSNYAVRAAEKLRKENQYCKMISVFIRTNYFRKQDKQYNGMLSYKLGSPTNDTRDIVSASKSLAKNIFRNNYNFIKAGVLLSDFYDEGVKQSDFFIPHKEKIGAKKLMQTIDRINLSGIGRVSFAAQGMKQSWSMKRELKSPRYSTNWQELLTVK